jgi:hypothetical protein
MMAQALFFFGVQSRPPVEEYASKAFIFISVKTTVKPFYLSAGAAIFPLDLGFRSFTESRSTALQSSPMIILVYGLITVLFRSFELFADHLLRLAK